MLLEKLKEYSERLDPTPVMYKKTNIHWVIDLDENGKYLNIVQTAGGEDKLWRGQEFVVPSLKRTSGVSAIVLADSGEYTLGLTLPIALVNQNEQITKQALKTKEKHKAYCELIQRLSQQTNEQSIHAILAFLVDFDTNKLSFKMNGYDYGEKENLEWCIELEERKNKIHFNRLSQHKELNTGILPSPEENQSVNHEENLKKLQDFIKTFNSNNFTFRVNGEFPFQLASIQDWWANYATGGNKEQTEKGLNLQECMICGKQQPVLDRHPVSIKGIRGGQAAGLSMISANAKAFESYGLEASLIAPTCQKCVEAYAIGLNSLLANPSNHFHINNLAYCFWTKEPHPFSILSFLNDPDPAEVKALLKSAFSGKEISVDLDDTPFYAAAFSASGARVVVRDWLATTVRQAKEHLLRFFKLQQFIHWDGSEAPYLGVFRLAVSLFRESKDISANVPQALLHNAFKGGVLPEWLLFQAVKRNRAEQDIRFERAMLIKMILVSQYPHTQEDDLIMLNPEHPDPAYHCGRLLAVLETVQRQALGPVNASIRDRYFGTASSAPASVFGTLLRGSQPHLSKLRKEKEGAYIALERKLAEVMGHIEQFPSVLDLHKQALFSLGFYHQKAQDQKDIADRKQQKEENHDQ
ncbi:MAG: type I-C CRISPR-associated protein Cas8c/Csd1 [Candidatus Sericytochromatia bacterium]|nr:type I-C CRISPR-associated protein Cas8c/Csd1 [Candidatus Sericytochromatia bacterium]